MRLKHLVAILVLFALTLPASTDGALLGETFAGQPITGADFVRMVGGV